MTSAYPSAYLNSLNEEGTREDLLHEVGRLYDENVRLRARIKVLEKYVDWNELEGEWEKRDG